MAQPPLQPQASESTDRRVEPADLREALSLIEALRQVLESEYELLKSREMQGLETLQARKAELLEQVGRLAPTPWPDPADEASPAWSAFRREAADCRELHRRNQILVTRKLEAIRGAIDVLRSPGRPADVETYDRSGRVAWPGRSRGYVGRGANA